MYPFRVRASTPWPPPQTRLKEMTMTTPPEYPKGKPMPFPSSFTTQDIETNGATLHTRIGGHGPAVVLLHGYGLTGDSWAPLAKALANTHTVIAPDLRGFS